MKLYENDKKSDFSKESCVKHGGLLIIGTDDRASVIKDIAENMGCFSKISFLDNRFGEKYYTPEENVIGKIENIGEHAVSYQYAIPSYSDGDKRLKCIKELEENCFRIPVIVSPKAYVSNYAQIQKGSVVEALASIQTNAALAIGVYISSGAVVNANSFVGDTRKMLMTLGNRLLFSFWKARKGILQHLLSHMTLILKTILSLISITISINFSKILILLSLW